MAGENFELDMGLFDFTPVEQEEEKEVSSIEQPQTKDINELADAEEQENVGEEVEEKALEEEEVDNPDSPANSDDELFNVLASTLKERGFFSNLEKDIKTEDDFAEALREEVKKNEFADLSESQKEYLIAIRNGIPDEVVHSHLKTKAIFENVTDDILENDETVRKEVIVQDRLAIGWSAERAEKDYNRIYNAGASYEEALVSRDNLKVKEAQEYETKVQQIEQNKVEQKKLAEQQLEELKKAVFKEDMLFGSFKANDGLKQKIYETMTKVEGMDKNGLPLNKLLKHRNEDPIGFDTALYSLYTLTDGFKNIKKLENKAVTVAATKLKNAIGNSTYIKSRGSGAYRSEEDETYDSPIVSLE